MKTKKKCTFHFNNLKNLEKNKSAGIFCLLFCNRIPSDDTHSAPHHQNMNNSFILKYL